MVIQINEFIETPSNKMEELQISNRNKFCFRFLIFIEEKLNNEDSSRRNNDFFFSKIIFIIILYSIYIYIYIYCSHGLVSIIICHSTNNSKDPHCKARILEKQKNNNCKENEIFVLIISLSKREKNLFLLIGF